MQATIVDIRRGDRFTRIGGRGGTYIALRTAKPKHGGERYGVMVIEDDGTPTAPDGTIDLTGKRPRIIDPAATQVVEIHERDLEIKRDVETRTFDDEPNPFMGGKTDRELAAMRLRNWIPEVCAKITDLGSERDLLVRQGLNAGIPAIELAELTGLSRARIYQIRDGRR